MRKTVLLVALGMVACSGPETFEGLADVTGTSFVDDRFEVRTQIAMVSEGLVLAQIGGVARDVAEGVQAGFEGVPQEAATLRVQLHFDSVDRLGNEGSIYVGAIDFKMVDVRSANLRNLPGEMFLDLAESFTIGENATPIVRACEQQGLADLSPFCKTLALTAL